MGGGGGGVCCVIVYLAFCVKFIIIITIKWRQSCLRM